ncbi:hypothetical protein KIH41_15215 [Litoribacter ruber]|uniref:Uncharacterized protein n=1 Tax=Litoribacter ruber TaxID=702568 RepID=A0AAP2G4R2_9BACT|nr:hypothetical protein [Litoribacter alkaliphilus]MBT0812637.1 hypothetical protein [Litoribacter ruber]
MGGTASNFERASFHPFFVRECKGLLLGILLFGIYRSTVKFQVVGNRLDFALILEFRLQGVLEILVEHFGRKLGFHIKFDRIAFKHQGIRVDFHLLISGTFDDGLHVCTGG